MGTRSCVIVRRSEDHTKGISGRARSADVLATLYRHWDGYPAIGGDVIVRLCSGSASAEALVMRLLAETSIGHANDERRDYELTTSADNHGDLEHVYQITHAIQRHPETMQASRSWIVEHRARPMGAWTDKDDDWRDWPGCEMSLDDFQSLVEREQNQMRVRMAAIQRANAKVTNGTS